MPVSEDTRTLGRARLTFADEAEIDEFAATLDKFERGEITPDAWRSFRLVRGTYGQRQTDDANMLRVKIPQGALTAEQLEALADVAERYSRGFGHITTRENMQFHFMKLHDVEPAMRHLADAGLTTREACGNSVRNITACPYAGIAADEAFDVTPYAEALTRHLLRHPFSSTLPRKFKIAFEGCPEDHAKTTIHDIGWRAAVRDGRRGFRVVVGGGTATLATSSTTLFDFLPAGEILDVADAVVLVFHRLGDYAHRQRNRMKFLIRTIGWDAFRSAFDAALAEVRTGGGTALPFDPDAPPLEAPPVWPPAARPSVTFIEQRVREAVLRGPGIHPVLPEAPPSIDAAFARWTATNVRPQKQPGFVLAHITLPLGDLSGAQMRVVGDLARAFGDATVRLTPTQNIVLRWIGGTEVRALYERLSAAGLGLPDAETIADVTSCPGAESCKLAVTQSRGLGAALGDHLRVRPDLVAAAPGLDIKISGCPNGCGQHHIAGIGFQGSLRKVGGRAVPQYFVSLGGGVDGEAASFGRVVAKIPARRCADALERLVRVYTEERHDGESARAFFRRVDPARVRVLLDDLTALTPESAAADDYVDLAESHAFELGATEGECSA